MPSGLALDVVVVAGQSPHRPSATLAAVAVVCVLGSVIALVRAVVAHRMVGWPRR